MPNEVRIGGYSAMWGDSTMSASQVINSKDVDYLVGDYLAEVTMSIMAKAHQKSEGKLGFAPDFVSMYVRNFRQIREQKITVVVNAGGVNPRGCREALMGALAKAYPKEAKTLHKQVRIGVVEGDKISPELLQGVDLTQSGPNGSSLEGVKAHTMSCNAYLGAFPIQQALERGCNVIITGRVVDSALVLGPLIKEHGWRADEYDKLASGTLAGHLIECGAQGSGGLYTDYDAVPGWEDIGYPIVKVRESGDFTLTKPKGTGGLVTPHTATEQLLYEIGNPAAYIVPDVVCDFTQTTITQVDKHTVLVRNTKGRAPTETYKCIGTYAAGYSLTVVLVIVGRDAPAKARKTAEALTTRWGVLLKKAGMASFTDTRAELIGHGGNRYEASARHPEAAREIVLRISVHHPSRKALDLVKREVFCAGVSMGQGTVGVQPGLPTPSGVVKCFTFLLDKRALPLPSLRIGEGVHPCPSPEAGARPLVAAPADSVCTSAAADEEGGPHEVMTLENLVVGRSGDKGDYANIGVVARRPEYLPFLERTLTPAFVRSCFERDCKGEVERFSLPGTGAFNFLLHETLGGGGTSSLHSDALAKTYASRLLAMRVTAPSAWRMFPSVDLEAKL